MTKIFGVAAYVRQNPSVRIGVDGTTDLLRGANQYPAEQPPHGHHEAPESRLEK
jgi:hypothetical protein